MQVLLLCFLNHSSSLTQDFVAPKQSVSMNLVMKGSRSVKKGFIKHKKEKMTFIVTFSVVSSNLVIEYLFVTVEECHCVRSC